MDSSTATNIRFSLGALSVSISANDNGFSHTCYVDVVFVGFGNHSDLKDVVVPDVGLMLC